MPGRARLLLMVDAGPCGFTSRVEFSELKLAVQQIRRTLCSSLMLMASLSVAVAAGDESATGRREPNTAALDPGPYCVTSKPSRKLSITVRHDLPAMQGVVYFPLPPDSASQRIT